MSTGNFENWDGNVTDLGPIYPFVGWEGFMVVLAVIIWVVWHFLQIKAENQRYEDQAQALRQSGALEKALAMEHTVERM